MAANRLELPLKVAGTGQQADELRELAGPTVDLVGWVDGAAKAELFSGARATLTACSQEDFGIVNVESIASGTPVIGPKAGFVQHQIQDGKNGLLYNDRLADAIRRFERKGVAWSPAQLADWARQNFGVSRFEQAMRDVVAVARDRAAVEPGFEPPRQEAPADD
jgi:glycosyltransferase involved in cell wall biosynthesis